MSKTWILSIETAENRYLGSKWSLTMVNESGSKHLVSASWGEYMTDSMLIGQDVEDYIASDIKDDLYVNNLFTHILRLNGEEQSAGQIGVIIQDLVPTKCVVLRGYLRREVKNDIQDDTAEKR